MQVPEVIRTSPLFVKSVEHGWYVTLSLVHGVFGANSGKFRVERRKAAKRAAKSWSRGKYTRQPLSSLTRYLRGTNTRRISRRPILFWHVHKAGGSSFIQLAHQNGEVLHPYHFNGNPCTKGMNQREALRKAIAEGVTFIAVEFPWQFEPDFLDEDGWLRCTQLREP